MCGGEPGDEGYIHLCSEVVLLHGSELSSIEFNMLVHNVITVKPL